MTDTAHTPRYSRFQRGLTPISPQRPLYGWRVSCSCGSAWRINGPKPEAERSFRAHQSDAEKASTDRPNGSGFEDGDALQREIDRADAHVARNEP